MAIIQKVEDAVKNIKDGSTVMIGGFLGVGAPLGIIDELVKNAVKDLTVISVVGANPGGNFDIGKLTANRQIKKFIGAHIGTDPCLVQQYINNEVQVEFNPMGTWIERIRAAGAGLGGVLTPTGLGTEMEDGREKVTVDGKEFLLYSPLKADIAIIKAHKADKFGNLQYRGTALNSNPVMATAADLVIAEVDEIVETGELSYNEIGTPGIFVDIIIQGSSLEEREKIFEDLWVKSKKLR
ncbi:CoA transferase subunit A [Clostridium aciditolerans]|uniref:CoA transferase subunit A n=1 Tax=Clostridium aciditolerans TaxID=339861 RepID=A0A934HPF5_9CLOT|nr:CoA transferase subunit A [Clostridium aciditolerans]MBI6871910.1 CoA transferase subunit A [Clostridium aciditolerans]